jgi:uncharacterized protein YegL
MKTLNINDIDAGNPSKRVPVTLLVDCSSSMVGSPIGELNAGIRAFKEIAEQDEQVLLSADISMISFGGVVTVCHNFSSIEHFNPQPLQAYGGTPMGDAIIKGLDNLEERKRFYRENAIQKFRPWIFLITDGGPTDEWKAAAERVHKEEASGKFLFFAVGVKDANMEILTQIAPPNRPPVKLQGLAFKEMFKWLSDSLSQTSRSQGTPGEQIQLPPTNGWGTIQTA